MGGRTGRRGGAGQAWLWPLLVSVVLTHTTLNLARPLISYRAIALGGDAAAVGLITAAYALLPVVMAVPLGRFIDRTRHGVVLIAAGTGLLAAASLALAAAQGLALIAAASAVLGVGHLVCMIAGQGLIARLSPDSGLDRAFGWFTAAASLGQLVGPLISGAVLGDAGGPALVGATTTALLIAGAMAALGLLPLAAPARLRPRPGTRAAGARGGEGGRGAAERMSSLALLRRPGLPSGLFSSLALLASIDILTAYLPLIAEARGISPATVGVLLAVRALTSLLSRLSLPWLIVRWRRRTLLTASTAGAGAALAVVALPIGSPVALGAVLALGGFLLGLGQPLTMTIVATAAPQTARATALALRLWGNRVGQVAIPAAAAGISSLAGTSGGLWLTSAVLAAAAAASWR
ncbi:MFS transporter [Streptomonospora nanhaiensis]|uniref:MFS family permease n=1 Tax=Streptomonospora nanhaiensis TaxID=1323731 RepID=A0A853BVK1_9ACTN|nr:MFS transporter [Streptomonospora nanhaiensis]MBV2365405.1 MFS transporter [Streptomonospora nanhaiensis]MBX9390206.1 MFS transporter [Streptomonospora nanhaiensis]NYI99000.1 MFS family permease [Streptomonospora nanhaiensis]